MLGLVKKLIIIITKIKKKKKKKEVELARYFLHKFLTNFQDLSKWI